MLSKLTRLPRFLKTLILVCVDAVLAAASFWLAAVVRDGSFPVVPVRHGLAATILVMMLVPVIGIACGLYRPVIRFHNPRLVMRAGMVGALSGAAIAAVAWAGNSTYLDAVGMGVVFALMLFAALVSSRHVARWLLGVGGTLEGTPVAIYGAGDAGRQLVAMFRRSREFRPAIFIDDDPSLHHRIVETLRVLSPKDKGLLKRMQRLGVKEILLAIPSLRPTRRREILARLAEFPFRVRSVPGLEEMLSGERQGLGDLRAVSIEDLLGRNPVSPIPGLLDKCIRGKVVLVSGGGGSIGSELCRQVLAIQPAHLIVLEHSELALYRIEQELRAMQAGTNARVRLDFVLGSVTDPTAVTALLNEFRVSTVYHAAAYKHVPIVEENPLAGLSNNVLGTWYLARAAAKAKVGHFILISSDKAVRPTNVMGATKRMAELVVQTLAERHPDTVFSMVRFGNVLGSSGSVVPRFREQIDGGGPITLTHAEMTRYFMTIGEAVQLVIQAGAMARGGEVFVLDMGEPVKIKDLALKMIHLSGCSLRSTDNPDGDIAIELIGLRPGEKLYEELLIDGEANGTTHPRIWQVREASADAHVFEEELRQLEETLRENRQAIDVRSVLAKWVSGYSGQSGGAVAAVLQSGVGITLH